jgi:hypothetical protein
MSLAAGAPPPISNNDGATASPLFTSDFTAHQCQQDVVENTSFSSNDENSLA